MDDCTLNYRKGTRKELWVQYSTRSVITFQARPTLHVHSPRNQIGEWCLVVLVGLCWSRRSSHTVA